MICRKCGSVLEKGIKVCPFCEEMAESDADNLMPQTREEKDSCDRRWYAAVSQAQGAGSYS